MDELRRWAVPLVLVGLLVGVYLSRSEYQAPEPRTRVERVRVITDEQIARLEAVVRAMGEVSDPTPAQAAAAEAAEQMVDSVRADGVTVVPSPTNSTPNPPVTTTTTVVPNTTTTTTRDVRDFVPLLPPVTLP